jgi:chromosomal replication initiator protein
VQSRHPSADDPAKRIESAFVDRITQGRFLLWFAPNAKFVWLGHELIVVARNAHFQEWANEKFGSTLRDSVKAVMGDAVPVRFVADPALFDETSDEPRPQSPPMASSPSAATPSKPATPQLNLFGEPAAPLLKPKAKSAEPSKPTRRWKTFADFVVGTSNRVAHAAAATIAEEPGLGPNPLVLHGPVGTGKTHLLEAVYVSLRKLGPDSRPVFVTAEDFTNRFVQSNRFGKMNGFRRQFRDCSALLFDDLHFLAGKRATQEEFLYTLDSLVNDGRQVVVTMDCHPRLADELMPELVDRLLGGTAWGLLPPDDETRLDILRKKSTGLQPTLSEDVLKYLARNLKGNVRELEGAVNSVRHFAKVTGKPATPSLVREAVGDLLRHTVRVVTIADIEKAVCSMLGLNANALQSKSRSWQVTHPRMLAVYLARKHTSATYGDIAKHFGVKQHSTAVAAEKKVRGWLQENDQLTLGDRKWHVKDLLDRIERELQR